MAQTIPDIKAPSDDWVSVNVLAGISVGTAIIIQNKSPYWVLLQESGAKPSASSTDGVTLTNLEGTEPSRLISSGSLEIWAKSTVDGKSARLSVQTVA